MVCVRAPMKPGEPRVVAELAAGAEQAVARARIERQPRSRRTIGDDQRMAWPQPCSSA